MNVSCMGVGGERKLATRGRWDTQCSKSKRASMEKRRKENIDKRIYDRQRNHEIDERRSDKTRR